MAYREVTRVEINEAIRRWQLGMSQCQIAHGTGVSPVQAGGRLRPTVRRFLAAAAELGLSADGPEPDEAQLARLAALSSNGSTRSRTGSSASSTAGQALYAA